MEQSLLLNVVFILSHSAAILISKSTDTSSSRSLLGQSSSSIYGLSFALPCRRRMALVSCIFGNGGGAVHTWRVLYILGGGCDGGILGTVPLAATFSATLLWVLVSDAVMFRLVTESSGRSCSFCRMSIDMFVTCLHCPG